MDIRIAAVVAAHPEIEKWWLKRYKRVCDRSRMHGLEFLGRDPLWYKPRAHSNGLWKKFGVEEIEPNDAYAAWRDYYVEHGALHTWNSKDMLTSSSTESEAISSTEDTV